MSTERFDIRHAPAPRESFRLLYISKSRFGGDWNSTVHTHSCTELFYCLSGEGQFLLSGQLFPVKPDDMVIVNPQVEHTELSLNASPLEYIVLGVSGIEILFGKADSTYAIFNCRERVVHRTSQMSRTSSRSWQTVSQPSRLRSASASSMCSSVTIRSRFSRQLKMA